jgi:hypothetical protein
MEGKRQKGTNREGKTERKRQREKQREETEGRYIGGDIGGMETEKNRHGEKDRGEYAREWRKEA